MLKVIGAALLFSTAALTTLLAQDQPAEPEAQTLFGNSGIKSHGFYVAPSVQAGPAQGTTGFWAGGRAAYLMNHRVALGVAGYGLASVHRVGPIAKASSTRILSGYGGLLTEFIIAPGKVAHLSIPVLIGAGGIEYHGRPDSGGLAGGRKSGTEPSDHLETDAYFVAEPGLALELNLFKYCRLSLGGTYRVVSGMKMEKSTNADFSGLTGQATLKFGIL